MGDGDEPSRRELVGRSSSIHRSSSSSANAANAEARMKFASVDALSELVWSPRYGLSLRCADFSFTGKPKLLSPNFFDTGHNIMALHHSNSKSSIQEDQEATREEVNQACSGRSNEMNRPLSAGIGGSAQEDMKPEREEIVAVESEEAGCSKRSSDSPKAVGGEEETRDLLANEPLRLESAASQEEPTNRGDDEQGDNTNNRVNRLESMDENNLATLAVVACESKGEYLPEDNKDVEKAGYTGSLARCAKEKGKEKASSDGDDESFGSVESCNSAGLHSMGKKRPGFEQQLILGSKRLKTLSQECLGSTSKLKQDSSFMNWISNMTKGIWKGNEEDCSPFLALNTTSDANGQVKTIVDQQQLSSCCLKENSGCRNTGFQSFFQSIYCPKKPSQDVVEMDSPNDANAASLQELPWIPEQCVITKGNNHLSLSGNEICPVAETNVSSRKVGVSQTSVTFSSGNKYEEKMPNISLLSLSKSKVNEEQEACGEADGKVSQCLTNRKSGLESLWISRFSSKSSVPHKKDLHEKITNEAVEEAINPSMALPIVSSMRVESSEAMASLFAKRLEAIKHIMPTGSLAENAEEGQTKLICFYCGKKGHSLRDCLEVTDTELRDLVQNISARSGREEVSSLCIRCFQLNHWAAACPNTPLYSSGAEDRAMKHAVASTSGKKLPLSSFTDVPKAVFDAVQVLRLTRTDVLKWTNTKKSVSGLEGFFLRLRLGQWGKGLGGTGYYVARIDGDTEGQSSKRHSENNSISVKVGGMTCFVESQFISNHDFLEEELKAWWRNAGKIAGKSCGDGIPSAEELSRKIQQRKMLGF